MELNILLRGQSNAQLMGEYNGGAQAMASKVEALLGFDGVYDKVSLEYSSSGPAGNTVYAGTSFLTEWLNARDGNWQNGWSVGEREQSLLNFVGSLSAAQKAEPTAVVWLHSEYDSSNAKLTPAEFESGVRFDADLVRQAFGQSAASLPYLFVSAIPYSQGTDEGHQAIRIAMEQLGADPAFNARIAARALDTDMDFQDISGDGKVDFGGPHQSNEDGLQTADRIALSLAQTWAAYAKPGSPVALENGQIDDLGPQVISATPVGTNQVAIKVGFDSAQSLAALDAAAATGTGWTVIGSNGTALEATAASLTGPDSVLVSFGAAVPAGSMLHYGHGYGRLEAADGSGQGHAIYDNEGVPLWTAAQGVAVGGAAILPAASLTPPVTPVTAGTALPPALFGSAAAGWDQAAQVWSGNLDFGGATYQTYASKADWGSLGGVQLAPASWDPSWSTHLAFDNLPDASIDLQAAGSRPLDVMLVSARGGAVNLGAGSDQLTWVAHSDAPGVGNTLVVKAGAGDDVIQATAAGLSGLARYDVADNRARYDAGYDGRHSLAEVHLGAGNASVTAEGAVKLLVFGGTGAATVVGGSQTDIVEVNAGGGTFTGGGGADNWVVAAGSGHATITDFAAGQDWLTFTGLNAGQLSIQAATEGGISGTAIVYDAAGSSVFLAGVAALGMQDIFFT